MMLRFGHIVVILYCLCFAFANSISKRAVGDLIWSQCGNITRSSGIFSTIPNVCVYLNEAENCGIMVKVTVNGNQLLQQRLDTNAGGTVCGTSGIGPLIQCSICSSFRDSPNSQQCVYLQPNCTIAGIPTGFWNANKLGCFPDEKIDFMRQCQQNDCPGSCSMHGDCMQGECNCNDGWFGSDCSINSQLFEKCQRVDQLAGTVCVRLIFKKNCEIALQTVLQSIGGLELYKQEQSYSIRTFNNVFTQKKCFDMAGCQMCLQWDNLELSKTNAHGCGTLSMTCSGLPVGSYNLGCFDDDQVIPACFGTCINDCSGHGTCDNGVCTCDSRFEGDDCSLEVKCPNNCGGKDQGSCMKGVCTCKTGFVGDDCSKKHMATVSFHPAYVLVPIIVVAGVAVFAFTVYFVRKRSSEAPKFDRFDLLENEKESELQSTE